VSLVKYNNNSISAITAAAGLASGAMTHIKTVTSTGDSNIQFVNGSSSVVFDSTYPIYVLKLINCDTSTNENVYIDFTDDTSSHSFDLNIQTSAFVGEHAEDGSSVARLDYSESYDEANGTSAYIFNINKGGMNSGSDSSASGEFYFFNPSSTTFVKHFIARINSMSEYPGSTDQYVAGYVNTTAAVTGFKIHGVGGNMTGTYKLYGLKDS
jgi:hypothetical protein